MHPSRPSATARLITRSVALAANCPDLKKLVSQHQISCASALLTGPLRQPWFDFALRHSFTRRLLFVAERLLLPGIIIHYLARKRWIAARARDAIQSGFTQIVVLGAGYDCIAFELTEVTSGKCFELDHPATQRGKSQLLAHPTNLHFVPIDLSTESPDQKLRSHPSFSPTRPTLIIAEGLMMYFSPDRVGALLRSIRELTQHCSQTRLLFSFMHSRPGHPLGFHGSNPLVNLWLRMRREPFLWGATDDALRTTLSGLGFRSLAFANHEALRAEILGPLGLDHLPLARGEHLCLASS